MPGFLERRGPQGVHRGHGAGERRRMKTPLPEGLVFPSSIAVTTKEGNEWPIVTCGRQGWIDAIDSQNVAGR